MPLEAVKFLEQSSEPVVAEKNPTALATMQLNASSLTLWKSHFELREVAYSLLEMSCNPRAV